jgi:hypothetical protein
MKCSFLVLILTYCFFDVFGQTNPNEISKKICLSTYNFACEICSNETISNEVFPINTFGLLKDGVGFLTLHFKFDSFNNNDSLTLKSIKIVRIMIRECLKEPYVLHREHLCNEEEIFFKIVESQIIDVFKNKLFLKKIDTNFEENNCLEGDLVISVCFINSETKDK